MNIRRLISQLAEEADTAVINPADIEKLKKEGVPLKAPPEATLEESLDILFEKRKEMALDVARALPDHPGLGHPSINSLYDEVRECMLFGLNGAAITLCGVLIEYTLKHAAYTREAGGLQEYDAKLLDEYEHRAFGPSIDRAADFGLLTPEWVHLLKNFKDEVRNPYSHYNIKKITKDVVARKVKKLKCGSREVKEKDIPAVEDPVIQAWSKPKVDAHNVFDVFFFADQVVRYLLKQIDA